VIRLRGGVCRTRGGNEKSILKFIGKELRGIGANHLNCYFKFVRNHSEHLEWFALLVRILEVPNSTRGLDACFLDLAFSWFLPVLPHVFWGDTLKRDHD